MGIEDRGALDQFAKGNMAMIAVKVVLEKLATFLVEEAQFFGGARQRIGELRDDLEIMRSIQQDAEERSESNQGIRIWVK